MHTSDRADFGLRVVEHTLAGDGLASPAQGCLGVVVQSLEHTSVRAGPVSAVQPGLSVASSNCLRTLSLSLGETLVMVSLVMVSVVMVSLVTVSIVMVPLVTVSSVMGLTLWLVRGVLWGSLERQQTGASPLV